MSALLDEFLSVLRIPERVARIAPIADAPLVPTVDELMLIAADPRQSDWLGDLPRDGTALQIALHCGDHAITICETWADENAAPPVPLCIMGQLRERLIAAAWERIYAQYDECNEDSDR